MLDAIKCVVDDNFVFSGRQCCAKMVGPIKMTFGLRIRVGPRNHLSDGVSDPHRNGQF